MKAAHLTAFRLEVVLYQEEEKGLAFSLLRNAEHTSAVKPVS